MIKGNRGGSPAGTDKLGPGEKEVKRERKIVWGGHEEAVKKKGV